MGPLGLALQAAAVTLLLLFYWKGERDEQSTWDCSSKVLAIDRILKQHKLLSPPRPHSAYIGRAEEVALIIGVHAQKDFRDSYSNQ